MNWLIISIAINIILVLVAFYYIRKLILRNERYEEVAIKIHNENVEYTNFIFDIQKMVIAATREMDDIDSRGILEKDDDVGVTFSKLHAVTKQLEQFITLNIKIEDEQTEEK